MVYGREGPPRGSYGIVPGQVSYSDQRSKGLPKESCVNLRFVAGTCAPHDYTATTLDHRSSR